MNTIIVPSELVASNGYSHAIASSSGKTVYLSGQVSFDANGKIIHTDDVVRQFGQVLHNLQTTMSAAGGKMTDIVKLNIFVKDKNDYAAKMKEIGKVYASYFGKYFPAMTLVEVSSLFEDDALLEIEGTAVIHP